MEAVLEKPKNSKSKQKKKKLKEDVEKESKVEEQLNSKSRPLNEEVTVPEEINKITAELPEVGIEDKESPESICSYNTGELEKSTETAKSEEAKIEEPVKVEEAVKTNNDMQNTAFLTKIDNAVPLKELMNQNSFDNLLTANKQLVQSLKLSEFDLDENLKSIKKNCKIVVKDSISNIRAYTESQLSALYTNSELEAVKQFATQFTEAELKGCAIKRHPLYELLEGYLQARHKLTGNSLEAEQLRQEYKDICNQIWTLETAVVGGRGECHDGNTVATNHSYSKATFHRSVFQTVCRNLGSLRKVITENHILYSYLVEVSRLQIEIYLQILITNITSVSQLQPNAPIVLQSNTPPHLAPLLSEFRLCISILFSFQRRLIRDTEFVKQGRVWLTRLVAILLRLANWQDHLFLLNHILRCPAGVGSWASEFIQIPLQERSEDQPFSSFGVNHAIATFCAILMPIEKREQFLEQIAQSRENPDDTLWVIVDSEGEEDEETSGTALRENDIVQMLSQLPLANLFRTTLLIQHRDGQDFYNHSQISEHHILRFLAFSTVFLKILQSGLVTFNQARYQQLLKRLCRFIRHIVQYATDQWEIFRENQTLDDSAMLERLQVEYDAFFLRATNTLYTAQKMGAWQFLAVVPYHIVSIRTIWKIFYLLHVSDNSSEILDPTDSTDFKAKLKSEFVQNQFEEKMCLLNDDESYYLLNTFANMVLARKEEDMDFIQVATMDLLEIGFINEATRENCSKNARILLTHITSKHPHLLHDILLYIRKKISVIGSFALYLFEDLPLLIWQPAEEDMEIISLLLTQNAITTNESRLARMILSRLNWDFNSDGSLFIPYYIHFKVALLLAEVVDEEPGYLQWAWQTAYRLRLHFSDKGFTDLSRISEMENLSTIYRGVREHKPFSCFLGLLMTSWGHLIPLVCTKGFAMMENLQLNQKHHALVFSLNLIVPLFLNCQESLINSEKFQNVLVYLLNVDRTYINMAKSLVATQHVVLEQFGNMIQYQLQHYKWYDLDSPRCLVRLWISSLVSVPNWNKDQGVLYLLDVILKSSFFHVDALDAAVNVLKDLLQCATPQENNTSISSLFKWASQSTSPQGSLLSANSLPSCVWLAYILITLEHDEREKQTGLWKEILMQLKLQKGKVNVDAAIKKAAGVVKVPSFTSSSLCIYRWAQQALDTPLDHPLLPLLWQKFFTLYLVRVPTSNAAEKGCLGEKFFDGIINLTFLKRLKKRLQETLDFYQKKIENCDSSEEVNSKRQFYEIYCKVFRAFSLWLEEPRLQEANLYLPSLPPQYESQLLILIVQGTETPWLEYVDYETVQTEKQKSIKHWKLSIYREKSNVNKPLLNPGSGVESADPVERILRRLTSYDSPKLPPPLVKTAPVIPSINLNGDISPIKLLETHFQTLLQFARSHNMRVSEYKVLDSQYTELVPQLYRSVLQKVKKQVVCKGTSQSVCTGAAVITLEMQEARINERIDHQIQINRNDYELMVSKCLQPPAQSLCVAAATIQKLIETLQMKEKLNSPTSDKGVELFYHVLSRITEEITTYPPTNQFFIACLEKLGQAFIYGIEFETPRLLNKILEEPSLVNLLVPHFSPINAGTTNFLHMYSTICNDVGQRYDIVFSLLSKFDIFNWLTTKQPKISQRTQFIELVIKGLTILNFEPSAESLLLHEVYRNHLICLFEYQFPEHYGDVLTALLRASNGGGESGCIAISVWMDILNSLSKPIKFKLNSPMKDQLRHYAQQQRLLNYQELLETARLLATHFSKERLQYGLYGLYPKYRDYVEVFTALIGMTGHALIISSMNTHQGVVGDKLCEIIWPYLRDMFAPWILPYWMQNVKDDMATWMQQLTDDRAILLPWIAADSPFAHTMVAMMFECVNFIINTLPACNCILSFVWQWFVTNFAHIAVKEHILNVVHHPFISLPWHNFWPSIADLELMLKVVEQYLPACHVFLGHVFMEIPWVNWMRHISSNASLPIITRVHQCLLHLLVKLPNEPNVRSNHKDKAKTLLVHAESFKWSVIEAGMYQQIIDWYVMSCDPLVLCISDPLDLDFRVLQFLKIVAHYHEALDGNVPHLLQKRHIYVRTFVKLVSVLTSKHKIAISSKLNQLNSVIMASLNHMEKVVSTEEELSVLLNEMFGLLNNDGVIKQNIGKSFQQWIAVKNAESIVLKVVFQTLSTSVSDNEIVVNLLESALYSYFCNSISDISLITWKNVSRHLKLFPPRQTELEQVLVSEGKLLTLHAALVQKVLTCTDSLALLYTLLKWLGEIKVNAVNEDKLPLLWSQFLNLTLIHCSIDEPRAASVLYNFAQLLLKMSAEKGISGWGKGFLGAIGIVKQDSSTLKFRFLSRALAGYIMAQLPEMKGLPQIVRYRPNASATVGQPGGNTECAKILLGLDFGQSQGEIKVCAELALKQIQDPANSLHNSRKYLSSLVTQLYAKPYLKDIDCL